MLALLSAPRCRGCREERNDQPRPPGQPRAVLGRGRVLPAADPHVRRCACRRSRRPCASAHEQVAGRPGGRREAPWSRPSRSAVTTRPRSPRPGSRRTASSRRPATRPRHAGPRSSASSRPRSPRAPGRHGRARRRSAPRARSSCTGEVAGIAVAAARKVVQRDARRHGQRSPIVDSYVHQSVGERAEADHDVEHSHHCWHSSQPKTSPTATGCPHDLNEVIWGTIAFAHRVRAPRRGRPARSSRRRCSAAPSASRPS